mmetsp:Transcript_27261/g.109195  ORF Transcript_27261/g.109195 Transcript_27261/m.109195 type:complete len:126 (-) Transcript_27261:873-1250(-)
MASGSEASASWRMFVDLCCLRSMSPSIQSCRTTSADCWLGVSSSSNDSRGKYRAPRDYLPTIALVSPSESFPQQHLRLSSLRLRVFTRVVVVVVVVRGAVEMKVEVGPQGVVREVAVGEGIQVAL